MRVEKKICARCGKRLPLGNFMLAANEWPLNEVAVKAERVFSAKKIYLRDSKCSTKAEPAILISGGYLPL